jgi:multidrug efflux pump subunit AcrA (membrane-fusion protein)
MRCCVRKATVAVLSILLLHCSRYRPPTAHAAAAQPPASAVDILNGGKREVRVTGTIQAVHSFKILVPQIYGNYSNLTLTRLIANGALVKEGDVVATFDATSFMDTARDAKARYDDMGHQVDQKRAQNRADAEARNSTLKQAESDLAKAEMELRKGPVLSEIDRLKNEERERVARIHVNSLKKSNALHDKADAAALRYMELQRDRQKVALDRAQSNIDKLTIKAPLNGMVAQEQVYRANTMGHAQEGDQLYRGQPLVSIFDPNEMQVRCAVGEPDVSALTPGVKATIYLDAYPELALPAHFEYGSPVASSSFGSPIKSFTAVFHIDKGDAHLLPDLSAAVVIESPPEGSAEAGGKAEGGTK